MVIIDEANKMIPFQGIYLIGYHVVSEIIPGKGYQHNTADNQQRAEDLPNTKLFPQDKVSQDGSE